MGITWKRSVCGHVCVRVCECECVCVVFLVLAGTNTRGAEVTSIQITFPGRMAVSQGYSTCFLGGISMVRSQGPPPTSTLDLLQLRLLKGIFCFFVVSGTVYGPYGDTTHPDLKVAMATGRQLVSMRVTHGWLLHETTFKFILCD